MTLFGSQTVTLTVGNTRMLECPECSAMVIRERMPRHYQALHSWLQWESVGENESRISEIPSSRGTIGM